MAQWLDATVVARTDWNDHLFSLRFVCPGFANMKAGQFTKLGVLQADGNILSRPYSLVNKPDAENLEIIAVPVAQGQLSPKLHELNIGDTLKVMAPATGFLVLDEVPQSRDLWLIATGTGVGPFISILQTEQAWQTYQTINLIYGARWQHDLAYLPLIQQWQRDYQGRFNFVSIVSRESNGSGLTGRIPALFSSGAIEKQVGLQLSAEQSQVMLCGNPQMITETISLLADKGLSKHLRRSPGQISMERYW